ncbi:Regulatory protein AtoC [bioreactor metagenome]|uniref:Regulatory protein AtoC n=1 Tax=bioreactor metagenome TaxID=1076179 RepID=A0A645CTM6_9ZZZZ
MMSINCAAIPSELLEAELFGYAEGAFTGAKKGGKRGKFQIASGGTLFLDEIGDMPLHMQAKILRALQEQEVDPVGGGEPVKVDVRIISATRQNLSAMIEQGLFREDLYYRLNVVNIEMPPLRERRRDIFELSNFFLTQLNHRYQSSVILSDDVKYCFLNYSWPGNIRELDNVIKAAYAICDGFIIDMTDLPAKMVARQSSEQLSKGGRRLAAALEDYECEIIKSVLQDKNGDCRQAAAELGLHRSVLYKKMAKLNIPTPRRQSAAQKP